MERQREQQFSTEDLVRQRIEEDKHYRFGKTSLTPKQATVVDFDERFNVHDLKNGEEFTLSGNGFLAVDVFLGRRTVFLERPINLDGNTYYFEVKGYGRNGRELYPEKHVEGDLYFGLYLNFAKKEFYLPRLLMSHCICDIQQPVALLQFNQDDFIRFSFSGLQGLLSARLQLGPHEERVREALHKLRPEYNGSPDDFYWEKRDELAKLFVRVLEGAHQSGGVEGVKNCAAQLNLEKEVNGITNGQESGYVIRAVKSPIRVGDLSDKSIVTSRNRVIARKIGQTIKSMLELGLWHISPNPGNWTTEGELVDFEDVVEYPTEISLIENDMQFRNINSLEDYAAFTFGEGTVGYLTDEFQEGFMGSRTTTQDVVRETLKILGKLTNKETALIVGRLTQDTE